MERQREVRRGEVGGERERGRMREEEEGYQGRVELSSIAFPEIMLSLEMTLIKEGKAHMLSQIPIKPANS